MTPQDHIQTMGSHLLAGRYDLIAEQFDFPLPVYINAATVVMPGATEFWTLLQSLHSLLRAGGYARDEGGIEVRLTAVEVPRNGRFRMWADWVAVGAKGAGGRAGGGEQPLFRTVCYNKGTHADHKTQMLRVESAAWPQLGRLLMAA